MSKEISEPTAHSGDAPLSFIKERILPPGRYRFEFNNNINLSTGMASFPPVFWLVDVLDPPENIPDLYKENGYWTYCNLISGGIPGERWVFLEGVKVIDHSTTATGMASSH